MKLKSEVQTVVQTPTHCNRFGIQSPLKYKYRPQQVHFAVSVFLNDLTFTLSSGKEGRVAS